MPYTISAASYIHWSDRVTLKPPRWLHYSYAKDVAGVTAINNARIEAVARQGPALRGYATRTTGGFQVGARAKQAKRVP